MFRPNLTAGYQGYQPDIRRISRPFLHRISWIVTPWEVVFLWTNALTPLFYRIEQKKTELTDFAADSQTLVRRTDFDPIFRSDHATAAEMKGLIFAVDITTYNVADDEHTSHK